MARKAKPNDAVKVFVAIGSYTQDREAPFVVGVYRTISAATLAVAERVAMMHDQEGDGDDKGEADKPDFVEIADTTWTWEWDAGVLFTIDQSTFR